MALLTLAFPLISHADGITLARYSGKASGWAIKPFVENDQVQNVPATDQATPFVFVKMDGSPSAAAKAAYFFPGSAGNTLLNQEGAPQRIPDGVDAQYPGDGSASEKVDSPFGDSTLVQASAAMQSAQASEGHAKATSALANYQFAPVAPLPTGTVPIPTVPVQPGSGATPTSTAGSGQPTPTHPPTPTPTKVCLIICLGSHRNAAPTQGPPPGAPPPAKLPDVLEQQLQTALRAAELAHPDLLNLAGGHTAAVNATLPYASADAASMAEMTAGNDGVRATVATHAARIQLFQGLITITTVDSTLQALAPASLTDRGSGTITTTITGAAIAGIPVTIDNKGVHVSDQGIPPDQAQALTAALNGALAQAGVQVKAVTTSSAPDIGYWSGAGGGLDVTATQDPSTVNSSAGAIPPTHVDFSIGAVSADAAATPGTNDDTGGGVCLFCGFGGDGGFGGGGDTGGSTPPSQSQHGIIIPGLSGAALLALAFVVQGISTAAVAAAAGYAEAGAKASTAGPAEEETK